EDRRGIGHDDETGHDPAQRDHQARPPQGGGEVTRAERGDADRGDEHRDPEVAHSRDDTRQQVDELRVHELDGVSAGIDRDRESRVQSDPESAKIRPTMAPPAAIIASRRVSSDRRNVAQTLPRNQRNAKLPSPVRNAPTLMALVWST